MCLSTVYKNEVSDANMLAKNVADVRIENGKILFTDLMGIRTVFDGTLEKVDLMDNYIIVKDL
ncbi:MAG: CooT family nickel-binding protein [Mogibacterium sp.]|nr:CooT family nickel-binding protein [Mogibacterium sp.]